MALRKGMGSEEISGLLNGEGDYVPPEEAKAVLFAQHYADAKGLPDEDAWRVIVREYGSERANIVLSAAQVMLAGNIYGGVLSALHSRIRGKPYAGSGPAREVLFLVAGACLVPVAGLEALARTVSGAPNVRMG